MAATQPNTIAPRSAVQSHAKFGSLTGAPSQRKQSRAGNRSWIGVNLVRNFRILPWKTKHNATVIQLMALPSLPNGATYATVWQEVLNERLTKLKPKDLDYVLQVGLSPGLNEQQLKDLLSTLEDSYGKKYSTRALEKVHPIVSHIQSFGRVMDTMVQSNPEIAALIWGGVRLIMEISVRPVDLHEQVLERLEQLSFYLPLFERWRRLFPEADFTHLSTCMREACVAFVDFLIRAINFLRHNAITNTLYILFRPSFQAGFRASEKAIKRQTDRLSIQVSTAGLESSKESNQALQDMLQSSVAAQPSPQKTQVNLPFRFIKHCVRNNSFFGRGDEIFMLERTLSVGCLNHNNHRLASVVVHGLGGLGKSSVALEYLYRKYDDYSVIIWLYAEKRDRLDSQFVQLARLLGLPVDASNINSSSEAVLHWMTHLEVDWLMVFDNADDVSALAPYWPSSKHGSIIITSRNAFPGSDAFAMEGLRLEKFTVKQGAAFLLSILQKLYTTSQEDLEAAQTISGLFDGLPLGLRQAACFMRIKKCRPLEFLELYNQERDNIEQTQIPGEYTKTVADVWEMSMSMLTQDAANLLDVLTLLDPDAIPVQLLKNHGHQGEFTAFLEDLSRYLNATSNLADQSLIDIKLHDETLSMHRFFQEATFRRLKKQTTRVYRVYSSTIEMVQHAMPEDDYLSMKHLSSWPIIESFLGHVDVLWARLPEGISVTAVNSLLKLTGRVAGYYHEIGQYDACDRWLQKSEKLAAKTNGIDSTVLSKVFYYRGRWAQESNRQDQAIQFFERATQLYESAVSASHLTSADTYLPILYQNMGMSYTGAERYEEAEKYLSKGLALAKQPGSGCRVVIGDFLQCLGACHLWNGDLAKAEDVLCRALLEQCGKDNENRGGALYTLGNVYLRQSKYSDALQAHKEVLQLYKKDLGDFHHWVADSCHKIGSILAIPGTGITNLVEAEKLVRRSTEIWAMPANVDDPHSWPCAARSKWKLARILFTMGKQLEEAQSLNDQACAYIREKHGIDIEGDDPNVETVVDSLVFYWSR